MSVSVRPNTPATAPGSARTTASPSLTTSCLPSSLSSRCITMEGWTTVLYNVRQLTHTHTHALRPVTLTDWMRVAWVFCYSLDSINPNEENGPQVRAWLPPPPPHTVSLWIEHNVEEGYWVLSAVSIPVFLLACVCCKAWIEIRLPTYEIWPTSVYCRDVVLNHWLYKLVLCVNMSILSRFIFNSKWKISMQYMFMYTLHHEFTFKIKLAENGLQCFYQYLPAL